MDKEFYKDKYYKIKELKIKAEIESCNIQRNKGIWRNIIVFGSIITILLKLTDLKLLNNDLIKISFLIFGLFIAIIILLFLNRRLDKNTLERINRTNKEIDNLYKSIEKWEEEDVKKKTTKK